MASFEAESSLVVLINGIYDLVKPFRNMAVGAICRNAILIELLVMIIFMAIFTLLPDLPETPFFVFLVAFCARRCNVSSIKREFAAAVTFNGKRCKIKAFGAMAISAICQET